MAGTLRIVFNPQTGLPGRLCLNDSPDGALAWILH